MGFRCGRVAVVGKPNVGKSTLVNYLVGEKVAITADKPQTTRTTILGIANRPSAQVIFLDTPGIHKPRTKLGKVMVDRAVQTLAECDAILFVVDCSRPPEEDDERIARMIRTEPAKPVVVALNKMDRLRLEHVEMNYHAYEQLTAPSQLMYTNGLTGENGDKLMEMLIGVLPARGREFADESMFTTQHIRDMAAEIIREKAIQNLREEVPHGVAVQVESWQDPTPTDASPITRIEAAIVVEKTSHKPILIGRKGSLIKAIGSLARVEIEKLIGTKVFLDLRVKVEEHWRDDPRQLRNLGLT